MKKYAGKRTKLISLVLCLNRRIKFGHGNFPHAQLILTHKVINISSYISNINNRQKALTDLYGLKHKKSSDGEQHLHLYLSKIYTWLKLRGRIREDQDS